MRVSFFFACCAGRACTFANGFDVRECAICGTPM
jgi:hypothetical protein